MAIQTLADRNITENDVERRLSNKERVIRALQEWGTNEIYASLSDIAAKTGRVGVPSLDEKQVYFAIYALAKDDNFLEILTENIRDTQRKQFAGVKLLRAERPEKATERAAERVRVHKSEVTAGKVRDRFPAILAYASKKLAIEKARQTLVDAGLSPDAVTFSPDSLGEEGIAILGEFIDLLAAKIECETQLAAANSNLRFLKGQRQPQV